MRTIATFCPVVAALPGAIETIAAALRAEARATSAVVPLRVEPSDALVDAESSERMIDHQIFQTPTEWLVAAKSKCATWRALAEAATKHRRRIENLPVPVDSIYRLARCGNVKDGGILEALAHAIGEKLRQPCAVEDLIWTDAKRAIFVERNADAQEAN